MAILIVAVFPSRLSRYITLAFAMMAVIRHRANAEPALKKTPPRRHTKHRS
jgi:hypothetical protein